MTDPPGPSHVVADSMDRRALCGVKDPLPVILARHAPRRLAGRPNFDTRHDRLPNDTEARLIAEGRRVKVTA